jgi:hypothetical protein
VLTLEEAIAEALRETPIDDQSALEAKESSQ